MKTNKPWWRFWKTKAEREKKAYDVGYAWAAGELLKGKSVEEVESYIAIARHFGDFGPFDVGSIDAIEDYLKLTKGELC